MKTVAILGAGKIGKMVCHLLQGCDDYSVRVGDAFAGSVSAIGKAYPKVQASVVDFDNAASLDAILKGAYAVVSCAPYHCNPLIAERAKAASAHYFDLTEDVNVTHKVVQLASGSKSAFVPQCGLAPGFITMVATHLMRQLDTVRDLRLRVGALPRFPSNQLQYNLTWSTEGLINEYCNPCEAVDNGKQVLVPPLEQLERLTIEGVEYEAFNTSGGLGTLAKSLSGKVNNLNYKTIRYPGHCELLKFLLHDLLMRHHKDELVKIFDRAIPATQNDQIVIFVCAIGEQNGKLTELTYAKTVRDQQIDGKHWTGIQVTTAAGITGVLDMMATGKLPTSGLVKMEDVNYEAFLQNRFGKYFA
ncbi:MAG: saccharopine dehydrogenase NADP-binding domain-containing protein [Planctomycetota bacterium]|nr:saccharopine dehydrogenase NADP-binding domain-containing protein [Planctomycetota bacterium]